MTQFEFRSMKPTLTIVENANNRLLFPLKVQLTILKDCEKAASHTMFNRQLLKVYHLSVNKMKGTSAPFNVMDSSPPVWLIYLREENYFS